VIREPVPDAAAFGDSITSDELIAWRRVRRVTQRELGAILGVAPLTVLRWELGQRTIPPFLHLALRGVDEVMRMQRVAAHQLPRQRRVAR